VFSKLHAAIEIEQLSSATTCLDRSLAHVTGSSVHCKDRYRARPSPWPRLRSMS
jgi:hypothetical protein